MKGDGGKKITHMTKFQINNYLDQKNTTEIQGGNDNTEMDEWIS